MRPNATRQAPPRAEATKERRLLAVACRVEPAVTRPAPPQTWTCAMNAYGSSSRAAAARAQSPGLPWSGLVSAKSLPCLRPADALPDGAFPPVGRLGLTSPPSPVLCAATTALLSLSGSFACRSFPDTVRASAVRGVPCGLVAWWKPQDDARACGHPVPSSGPCAWRPVGCEPRGLAPTG